MERKKSRSLRLHDKIIEVKNLGKSVVEAIAEPVRNAIDDNDIRDNTITKVQVSVWNAVEGILWQCLGSPAPLRRRNWRHPNIGRWSCLGGVLSFVASGRSLTPTRTLGSRVLFLRAPSALFLCDR